MRNFKQIVSVVVITLGLVFFVAKHSYAQVDSTAKKDTIPKTDTIVAPPPTAATTPAEKPEKRSNFIIYAGPNWSTLRVGDDLNNESETGFHIGMSWRTKGFFHGQFGIRYNNAVFDLLPSGRSDSGDHKFSISSLDFPLTGAINILPGQGLLNLRAFISAVPSFNIGMGDNDYYEKDNVETFVFYGQIGIGMDVFFGVLEVGYNYGFTDMLKDKDSEPGQVFVNIGVRF
jgi:Outer membrane protein beta-barrel domain